jgi:enoyl-CoA hydratase/carnithine racemase
LASVNATIGVAHSAKDLAMTSIPTATLPVAVTNHPREVVVVTLNRPDVANAFNTAMATALADSFESLARSCGQQRCVVVRGAGDRAFCSGADLKERAGMSDQAWCTQHLEIERMIQAIFDCPLPVIAAVNGAAYGGGCEIALACDFIYASQTARFALPEVTRGIMPGAGGTQALSRAIGTRAALEMLLTGRAIVAQEAHRIGLVNVLCEGDVLSAALDCAQTIGRNAPLAVREIKSAVHDGWGLARGAALERELAGYRRLVSTDDRLEGINAFNEKREPVFRGR